MSELADVVLPLIRTRAEVWRWNVANAHGTDMHAAVDILERALDDDPTEVYAVTKRAIASAVTIILRADDSSGIIGDAIRRLLQLHAAAATAIHPPVARLVTWMIKFQFDGQQDFFQLDPVAYADALGPAGIARYRAQLATIADRTESTSSDRDQFALEWNARRLAVLDRDVEAIIATHARDRAVAAWFCDTAAALAEIAEFDLAIDWAHRALDVGPDHQSLRAAEYWCELLAQHRPTELLAARSEVFRHWPSSKTAARLHAAAGSDWSDHLDETMRLLSRSPRDAVLFALLTLHEVSYAWSLANSLGLRDADTWRRLCTAYEKVDPLAVLPVLADLVEGELERPDAQHYQFAARRLKKMRRLAAGSYRAGDVDVDDLIAALRETHRRRPRLQLEFDRAGLP